jgi:hypothetical protein
MEFELAVAKGHHNTGIGKLFRRGEVESFDGITEPERVLESCGPLVFFSKKGQGLDILQNNFHKLAASMLVDKTQQRPLLLPGFDLA